MDNDKKNYAPGHDPKGMDHTKILNLLHIYEKAHQGGAPLTNIRDAAYKELLAHAKELEPKPLASVDYTPTPLDKAVSPGPKPLGPGHEAVPQHEPNGETSGINRRL